MFKITALLFCFALTLSVCSLKVKAQAVSKRDSLALVDLYNSTNGPFWFRNFNWLTGPVKTWYGITVADTVVTYVDLQNNTLNGVLPPSIGDLVHALSIRLENNHFDTIPASIGKLENVLWLGLAYCQLKGKIPTSIGDLSNLNTLILNDNQLTGQIPSSIGNIKTLSALYLHNNMLTGPIPSSIGNLTGLEFLYLYANQLTGSLPSSIGKLTSLDGLYLFNNQLSGTIPTSIGKLSKLRWAYFNSNQFSGSIPSSMAKLKPYELNLSNNNLSGDVSPLAYMTRGVVNISYNHFTFQGMEALVQAKPSTVYSPQGNIPIIQSGDSLYVIAGGTPAYNKYHWILVEDSSHTTIRGDSVFHPQKSGLYYANITNKIARQLTLTTDTINFTMLKKNVDGVNSFACNGEPVQTKDKPETFLVYPDPAKDILHVHVQGTALISLIGPTGKIIFTNTVNGDASFDISNIHAGTYFLKNNQTGAIQKFIKID